MPRWIPTSIRHWNARYLTDRALLTLYQVRHRNEPWLAAGAASILNQWLRPTDVGVEWGSGRSTLWLSQRIGRLASTESDEEWHEFVRKRLSESHCENAQLRFAPLAEPVTPEQREAYVRGFKEDCGGPLDFALVDGHLREACAVEAMRQLRPGGLLVIDDAQRYLNSASRAPDTIGLDAPPPGEVWPRVQDSLKAWRSFWACDGVSDTAFFVKPPDEAHPAT